MKAFFRSYYKTIFFFVLVGLVGGFFTGLYLLGSYPPEIRQQFLDQGLNDTLVGIVTAVQSAGYGLVFGVLGILLGKKIGLWRDERTLMKTPLLLAAVVSVVGGMVLILSDIWFFSRYVEGIREMYVVKPTVPYLLACVTYGAVIEEVLMRLFLMSLIAWILWKIFSGKTEKPSAAILIVANVITAFLFAAGHLPATLQLFGSLTPMILFRCFFLNGGLGLCFGWLYRKHGLRYAMIAHGGCHVVSKLIWILFI